MVDFFVWGGGGGFWAAEQCKRVCCEMDPRRSGWKVKSLITSGGHVEDGSGSTKSLLQERVNVFGWERCGSEWLDGAL